MVFDATFGDEDIAIRRRQEETRIGEAAGVFLDFETSGHPKLAP